MGTKNIFLYCEICSKEIPKERKRHQTCSVECGIIFNYPKKNCDVCGNLFQPKQSGQIRCSPECAKIKNKMVAIENRLHNTKEFNIFNRDKFQCIYCGKSSIEDSVKLQVEHVIPLSKGGETDIHNLITSCERCNFVKGQSILDVDTIERLLFLIKQRNSQLAKTQLKEIYLEIERIKKSRPKSSI